MENKVDIKIATLWRGGHVMITLDTLINQSEFGSADITCNNWTDEQFHQIETEFCDERIRLHRHNNEKGSNEKLRYVGNGTNQYIGLFDDDIKYASDYLSKLIAGCNKYNAMVSLHGVILDKGLIQSYYRNRIVFRGLGYVGSDVEVDVASNCGSLWKREWFKDYSEWYEQCGEVSMDDCYVAYFMKKKGIRRYVLSHKEGYITHKEQVESDDYVFNRYALVPNGDVIQTTFINSFFKKL